MRNKSGCCQQWDWIVCQYRENRCEGWGHCCHRLAMWQGCPAIARSLQAMYWMRITGSRPSVFTPRRRCLPLPHTKGAYSHSLHRLADESAHWAHMIQIPRDTLRCQDQLLEDHQSPLAEFSIKITGSWTYKIEKGFKKGMGHGVYWNTKWVSTPARGDTQSKRWCSHDSEGVGHWFVVERCPGWKHILQTMNEFVHDLDAGRFDSQPCEEEGSRCWTVLLWLTLTTMNDDLVLEHYLFICFRYWAKRNVAAEKDSRSGSECENCGIVFSLVLLCSSGQSCGNTVQD